MASSCISPGGHTPTNPTASVDRIVAQVLSYELVVNQPGRLLVALLTGDDRWLSFGGVRLRFNYLADASGAPSPRAAVEATTAQFLAIPGTPEGIGLQPTLTLRADGRGVYAAEPITLPRAGYWQLVAAGRLEDGSTFEAAASFAVRGQSGVLSIGDIAPRTDNPVIGTPGVEPAALDSRAAGGGPIPDPELHRMSIAEAIGLGHPALVVFSQPAYCENLFCGPVTDLVAELAAEYADRAEFIHVETYSDAAADYISQAARDWLVTDDGEIREPWTFLIDAHGRIVGSWDTIVSRAELEPLLAALPAM